MSNSANVNELFKNAQQEGSISPGSLKALNVIGDLGQQIQEGLGVVADSVQASEVVLVTTMIDDSGSIRFASNAQLVRDGHNQVIDALSKSKQNSSLLLHTRYLNGTVLFPYCALDQVVRMDQHNYDPNGGTPLYDQSVVLLGTVLAKTQEFSNSGVPARTVTLIVTDGADESSRKATPGTVKAIVTDMLKQERHIIAAMGIDDGRTDFRQVFGEMGIEDKWILTPGNSQSEIRKAFLLFSQSAVRASQNAASFSKTSLGGFGVNP